jgi:type II secretion system protein N
MKRILELIIRMFRFHKLKLILALGSTVLFALSLFPFSDLTDLITGKVLEATQNQILFQADKLNLGLFPSLNVEGEGVSVDVGSLPTIEAKKIIISPSLFSLFSLALGGSPNSTRASIDAQGFMGGTVYFSHKPDGSNDEGAKKSKISVDAESIQLGEIEKFVDSPISFQGKANLKTSFDFYPNFDGQPDGEIQLSSKSLKIPAGTVPTQFGPVPIPGVNLSALNVKGRLNASNFYFEDLAFGSAKDPLFGRVKGQMNIRVDRNGPIFGAYDLKIELNLNANAEKDFDSLLVLLKDYRQAGAQGGGKYIFRVMASSTALPPNMTRLTTY